LIARSSKAVHDVIEVDDIVHLHTASEELTGECLLCAIHRVVHLQRVDKGKALSNDTYVACMSWS